MAIAYKPADDDVLAVMSSVLRTFHQLYAEEVTLAVVMAAGSKDEQGDIKTPPCRIAGVAVPGTVEINNLKRRSQGMADATLTIDADEWNDSNDERRRSLFVWLISQIESAGEKDDANRPKLKKRPPDFAVVGWWDEVQRSQESSLSVQAMGHVVRDVRQYVQLEMWG